MPLDAARPELDRLGAFVYAGGLALSSRQTARLHGLSDLKVRPDGRVLALGDQSDLVEARLRLDADGRLVGLDEARLTALKDEQGADLFAGGQREYDSEGLALLADGDMIVGFEQHDRVLRYPADGGPPVAAPAPDVAWRHNKGMEGLAAEPRVGADAYRVGVEATGETFVCRLRSGCVADVRLDLEGMELSALEVLPDGRLAYLLRAWTPGRGNVVRLRVADRRGRVIDGFELAPPLVNDNFEGLGAVAGPRGVRFYLVSDDNFGTYNGAPTGQRTLLLAFDWRP